MEENEIIENVKGIILKYKTPSYQTSNKREVRIRCPYCGDSQKDSRAAHLYIEMKPPFKFYCQKCSTSGVLNQSVLKDLQIYDNTLNSSLAEGKILSRKNSGIKKMNFLSKKIISNVSTENEVSLNSLNYFNKRFNTTFDSNFLEKKFKCILSPMEFIEKNKITFYSDTYNLNTAIGFLSYDNSHAVFRDTSNLQKKRYYNLNLFPYEEESIKSKSYTLSSNINILSEKVNLVITEGIFDIIGVYIHFFLGTENEKNTIFSAACGKGFLAVINNFIRLGFLDLNISIYSDSDVNINFYKSLKKSSIYLKNSQLTIFYNDKEKDFGVS